MMLLPKKVGPFTLMRKLGSDGVTESYVGILDEPAGKQVVVRKVLPWIARDAQRLAEVEARVKDLLAVRHPVLVPILDYVCVDEPDDRGRYLVEEWLDAVDLEQVVVWCRAHGRQLPANVYLNLATQICNGLEALHSRPGAESGAESVLHMALRPRTIFVTVEGKVIVGDYGLMRSPTSIPPGGLSMPLTSRMEYLSPEQTHQDQKLGPPSDVFALGAVLYELLALHPMFRADSNLQTIHRVRRAEVTTQLLEVKELLPGLDKVLYRALSLNPRHRYQRAFVLREDLRGLMAGFSFANITDQTREFLLPLFQARGESTDEVVPSSLSGAEPTGETTGALLDMLGADPETQPGVPGVGAHTSSGALPLAVARDRTDPRVLALEDDTSALLRSPAAERTGPPDPLSLSGDPPPDAFDDEPVTDVRPEPDEPPRPTGPETTWIPHPAAKPVDAAPAQPAAPAEPAPPAPKRTGLAAAAPPPKSRSLASQAPPPVASAAGASATPAPVPSQGSAPRASVASDEVASDDFDDLPVRKGGPLPYVMGAAALVAVGAFGLVCAGVGGTMFLSGGDDPGTPDRLAVASATPSASADQVAPPADPEGGASEPPVAATATAGASLGAERRPARPATRPDPQPAPVAAARIAAPPRPAPSYEPDPTYDRQPSQESAPAYAARAAAPEPSYEAGWSDDAAADLAVDPIDEAPLPIDAGDLATYSDRAHVGRLTDDDRTALSAIDNTDPDRFTRARALLYLDAKARGDLGGRRGHLLALMSLPDNQYKPEWIVEQADLAMDGRDYATALERASFAERHWARLPPDLIFSRKTTIYEIQASASTGLFYASEGEDLQLLLTAIRSWEKYRRHVASQQRQDLISRADKQLYKLQDMQRRLE